MLCFELLAPFRAGPASVLLRGPLAVARAVGADAPAGCGSHRQVVKGTHFGASCQILAQNNASRPSERGADGAPASFFRPFLPSRPLLSAFSSFPASSFGLFAFSPFPGILFRSPLSFSAFSPFGSPFPLPASSSGHPPSASFRDKRQGRQPAAAAPEASERVAPG